MSASRNPFAPISDDSTRTCASTALRYTRLLLQRPVIEGTNGEKVNERASDTGIYLAGGLGILAFEGPVERRGDGIVHRFGKRAATAGERPGAARPASTLRARFSGRPSRAG